MRHIKKMIAVGLGATLLLAACGGGTSEITVKEEWGRTSPKVAAHGVFYLTITGGESADVFLSGTSEACEVIELHDTVMSDSVMEMVHLPDGIDLLAGEEVLLEPGGLHMMCINKQVDFVEETTVMLTLEFEEADPITLEIEIRDE